MHPAAARASEPQSTVAAASDLFAADPATGVALRGFDPVSYFLDGLGMPRPGRPTIECGFAGGVWRFASRANREAFLAAPDTYLPRLGGYDVIGAARGRLVDADPLVTSLVGGRLYLFRAPEGRDRAAADPLVVATAEQRWNDLRRDLTPLVEPGPQAKTRLVRA